MGGKTALFMYIDDLLTVSNASRSSHRPQSRSFSVEISIQAAWCKELLRKSAGVLVSFNNFFKSRVCESSVDRLNRWSA